MTSLLAATFIRQKLFSQNIKKDYNLILLKKFERDIWKTNLFGTLQTLSKLINIKLICFGGNNKNHVYKLNNIRSRDPLLFVILQ